MSFFVKHKNYIVTFGTEFFILILGFIIFRIASERMTEIGFSEYALSRRNISFLQPLLMIGLGVAVPRYISISPDRNSFLPAGLFLLAVVGTIFLIILGLGNRFFSTLFFGNDKYQSFIVPLTILLIGYGYHAILYGYLRGKKDIFFSNFIQFLHVGILPIMVLFHTQNIPSLLLFNGVILILLCVVFSISIFIKNNIQLDIKLCLEDVRTLLNYGIPRVLGDFALLAILTFPAYIVLSISKNVLLGGDVAYSITLLNLIGAAFGPISIVLLPEIGGFMREKRFDLIRNRFYVFVLSSITLTLIGYLIFYFFHDFIFNILLGTNHRKELFDMASIMLLGSFGYVLYIVLRSFLDAIHVQAKNATNLIIVLIIYVLLIVYGNSNDVPLNDYLYYFVVSLNILGILTLIKTYLSLKNLK